LVAIGVYSFVSELQIELLNSNDWHIQIILWGMTIVALPFLCHADVLWRKTELSRKEMVCHRRIANIDTGRWIDDNCLAQIKPS